MAFNGYFLKIGDCTFQNPAIKREGWDINPRIVQVTETKVLASGKISIKPLPHKPTVIFITFPVMTEEQWRNYCSYFRGVKTGEDEMFLTVEYYDDERDGYFTGTFYHTDLRHKPVIYNGEWMVEADTVELHEH